MRAVRAVSVPPDITAKLERHAEDGLPNEACGMLLGRVDGAVCVVQRAMLTPNSARSPVRFSVPDADILRAYKTAERRGMEVVGVYHSHPGSPAVPSDADLAYMDINPGVWLIRSGLDGRMRAWVLEGTAREIVLRTYTGA